MQYLAVLCCQGNSCRDRYREDRGWYRRFYLSYELTKTAVLGKIVGFLRMKLEPQRGVFWRHLGDFLQVIEAGKNDVVNNVAALKRGWLGKTTLNLKSKSMKLLVLEEDRGVLAQFETFLQFIRAGKMMQ